MTGYRHPVWVLLDLAEIASRMGEHRPGPVPCAPARPVRSYEWTVGILDRVHGEVIECRELRGAADLRAAAEELRGLEGAGRLLWSRVRPVGAAR